MFPPGSSAYEDAPEIVTGDESEATYGSGWWKYTPVISGTVAFDVSKSDVPLSVVGKAYTSPTEAPVVERTGGKFALPTLVGNTYWINLTGTGATVILRVSQVSESTIYYDEFYDLNVPALPANHSTTVGQPAGITKVDNYIAKGATTSYLDAFSNTTIYALEQRDNDKAYLETKVSWREEATSVVNNHTDVTVRLRMNYYPVPNVPAGAVPISYKLYTDYKLDASTVIGTGSLVVNLCMINAAGAVEVICPLAIAKTADEGAWKVWSKNWDIYADYEGGYEVDYVVTDKLLDAAANNRTVFFSLERQGYPDVTNSVTYEEKVRVSYVSVYMKATLDTVWDSPQSFVGIKFDELVDNFNVLDTAVWDVYINKEGYANIVDGQLAMEDVEVRTVELYDLLDSHIYMQLNVQSGDMGFIVQDYSSAADVGMYADRVDLRLSWNNHNTGSSQEVTIHYDPDKHRWLQFRQTSDGVVHFESSPDGVTWTELLISDAGMPLSYTRLSFFQTTWSG